MLTKNDDDDDIYTPYIYAASRYNIYKLFTTALMLQQLLYINIYIYILHSVIHQNKIKEK